ncbi:Stonustoxin subunit alpha, partial [Oryzias melastigma]
MISTNKYMQLEEKRDTERERTAVMSSDQVQAALGRPFALGMLYDARKEKLITDFILWDGDKIQSNKVRQSQKSSAYEITASDSIQSKSSLLDVSASLSASFLGGLIEVGGSASYLKDNKKFKNQSRVTLQYKATTEYEGLNLSQVTITNTQIKDAIKNSRATHVVTGILYGANAFFVFDSEKVDSRDVQKIDGSMQALIKKIPNATIDGKVDIKLSDEERDMTNKFSCKFYGDFILDSNPSTFEDAVKTYVQLPKLLGETLENTVPVKVWLSSLRNLEPLAEELKADICVSLVRKAENALDDMREIEMRSNDALDENVKVEKFLHLCEDYTETLKRTMEKKFPAIREGKEDEGSVHKVFEDLENSPFCQKNLDKWLDNVEREINVLTSCVNIMEGVKIVSDESELDREILAPGVEDALCFVFTSLETEDPYLKQMEKHLSCHETERPSSVTPPSKDHWFFNDQIFTDMRQKAKEFNSTFKNLKSSKKYSFVIAALPNQKHDGATIYHYRDGRLKTEDFSKPVPNVRSVTDRRELLWYFCNLTLDENTAYNCIKIDNRTAVYMEFNRIVGKNLRLEFYDNIDRHSSRLIEIFCSKRDSIGQLLTQLSQQTKTNEPTDIRTLVLRGLPVLLGDNAADFYKTYTGSEDCLQNLDLGILFVEHSFLIVIEGEKVMDNIEDLPKAVCILFALTYALHLSYPKSMKNTFQFIQQ